MVSHCEEETQCCPEKAQLCAWLLETPSSQRLLLLLISASVFPETPAFWFVCFWTPVKPGLCCSWRCAN